MHMEQERGGLWRAGSECLTGVNAPGAGLRNRCNAAEKQVQSSGSAPGLATPPWTTTRLRDGQMLATPSTKVGEGRGFGEATPLSLAGYQGRLTMMNGRPLFLVLFCRARLGR